MRSRFKSGQPHIYLFSDNKKIDIVGYDLFSRGFFLKRLSHNIYILVYISRRFARFTINSALEVMFMVKTVAKDAKKPSKEEYDVEGIISIDEKKKGDELDLGRDELDGVDDDDELDFDADFEFDDGGD